VALERGELQLAMREGALVLRYFDRELPLNPRQSPRVFRPWVARLAAEHGEDHPHVREFLSVLTALQNLPPYTDRSPERIAERQREKEVARERLGRLLAASEIVARFVDECITRANGEPGVPATFEPLHDLLETQAFRLASWRTASDEINYRRFFDINELAGLRVEDPRVFDSSHGLVLELVRARRVSGIRVDHPDGLFDPATYFARLQAAARAALGPGPSDGAEGTDGVLSRSRPLYVVAEKILAAGERLRTDWAVHGTTGYNFLNTVNGLFVDASNGERMRRIYRRFTGNRADFGDIGYEAKQLIMNTSMASELNVLAHALNILSEASWRSRDFTLNSLRKALVEVIACFPVYRTYVSRAGSTLDDRAAVDQAIARACRRNPAMESTIFGFIRDVLLPDDSRGAAALGDGPERFDFAMRFQQYSGPVHAKGIEDTAFYRYAVLLSLNEVGGHPERFGASAGEFHAESLHRLTEGPLEMIATSTHDTKRGEDARARLNVLSELPDAWRRAVSRWMRINASNRRRLDGDPAPDRNDEYTFYQVTLASWPAEASDAPVPAAAPDHLVERLVAYMQKATKEAKRHTSWLTPNEAYDAAVGVFVRRSLAGPGAKRFLESFVPFQRRVARLGALNSLGQLALKLASPGVPDTYQGCELWDLSLVDPDNRRPVDYEMRRTLLARIMPLVLERERDDRGETAQAAAEPVSALLRNWPDGCIKLFATARGLRYRRAHPDLFRRGDYIPLDADDVGSRHVLGFARRFESAIVLALASRWTSQLLSAEAFPMGPATWKASRLLLPPDWRLDEVTDLLTGQRVQVRAAEGEGRPSIALADLLQTMPAGWWYGSLK
jgi:(1->4)-alpha-D-glucan 1-alpha-D-glucosylmutase